MAMFEGYDRRIEKITKTLDKYGFESLDQVKEYVNAAGVDTESHCKGCAADCL